MEQIGVFGPNIPLNGRLAANELEPARIHAVRHFHALAALRLLDEPLRAVKPMPIEFGGELASKMALDRSYELHGRFTMSGGVIYSAAPCRAAYSRSRSYLTLVKKGDFADAHSNVLIILCRS